MRRRLLHAAEVVRDLVQHHGRLPPDGAGVVRRVGPHRRHQAARVADVARVGAVVALDLRDAPLVGLVGQALGSTKTSRGPGGGTERGRDLVEQVVEVARAVEAWCRRSSCAAACRCTTWMSTYCGPHSVPMSKRRARRPPVCSARYCSMRETSACSESRHVRELVGLVARVGVDDLDLRDARGKAAWTVSSVVRSRAAPGRRQELGQVGCDRARHAGDRERAVDVGARELGRRCRCDSARPRRARSPRARAPAAARRRRMVPRGA